MKLLLAALAFLLASCIPALARPLHIVAFGDSMTAGWLVPHKDAYPAQLQAALRKKGYDVVVDNEGVNGDTATGALRRFDRAIGPDTDIALVEFGINDRRRGAPLPTVQTRLAEIVRTLRARKIEVLLIGAGGLNFSAIASANGALYASWILPPHKYRARDGAHLNAQGYALVVARMLPQVEALIAGVERKRYGSDSLPVSRPQHDR
jgi:acyl-CoA thioesterase-1